jgi:hypothetical protein
MHNTGWAAAVRIAALLLTAWWTKLVQTVAISFLGNVFAVREVTKRASLVCHVS